MGALPEQVDLAVIGGGVGGYVAAIRGAQLGLNTVVVEKNKMGGQCLNYACIPSKSLIYIADLFYNAQHAQQFGITVENAKIDGKRMYDWRMSVSKKLEDGVEFLCKSNQVEVIKGTATFISPNTLQLTNGTNLDFKKAIIATGSSPTILKGFEFDDTVIDYKQALMMEKIPQSMAIIGAGYVAVEIGTLYAKLGTKVSIVARSDVLSHFDVDAVALVKKRMQELKIDVVKATPKSHTKDSVAFDDGKTISAEVIVVAIGLEPYTEGLGLENTTIKLDEKGFITTDNALRTSDPDILAIGDVQGQPMLAHKAMRQGVVAAEVAAGKNASFDNLVIPSVIFSDPEIALAGRLDGDDVKVKKFPLTALGRAIALDKTTGFVKIAYDMNEIVKGIEIVSEDANSMISEAALAIEMGATLEDIADTIHPHPTFSEAVQEAAEAGLGRSIHFFYGKE